MMTIQNGVKEVSCAALLQTIVPTSCRTVVEHGLEKYWIPHDDFQFTLVGQDTWQLQKLVSVIKLLNIIDLIFLVHSHFLVLLFLGNLTLKMNYNP